ncbi:MAG: glycogen-binding domain-containing protein [Gemmatimonadota bacterium]|nr:glycogen-binding domain-containing protein [Gemmatimonadota bacterium]
MIRRAALGLLALATARTAVAQAPPEVRLEAGYASVRQAGIDTKTDAALVAVFWRRPSDRWTFLTSGNLTYSRDSLAAAQGVAAFALPWTGREYLRTDVGAAGATFSLRSAGRGGNGNAFVRQHYVRNHGGAWLGLAGGTTRRDGNRSSSLAGDVGAWGRWHFVYASLSFSRQASNDFPLLVTAGVPVSPFARTFELEDAQLVLQARGGPHEVAVSWTNRRAVAGAESRANAVSASGVLQLTERVALTASAGRQFADALRGLPQADIATASFRVSLGPRLLPVMQRSVIARAEVEKSPAGGGELVVHVFSIESQLVEVAGDFSEWQPLPLERDGSYWVARVRLAPGKYRVGVRVNHGEWRAPRNLARVRDDFGGESGLIVVP